MSKNKKGTPLKTKHTLSLSSRGASIIISALMTATLMWLLAIYSAYYLQKIESLQIFQPTRDYLQECMRTPAGLLTWAATFLTQTFYYPWLGALVYVVLMWVWALAATKAFRVSSRYLCSLAAVPAAAAVSLVSVGYIIYSLKTPGHAMMLPLGMISCTLMFWAYRVTPTWWGQALLMSIYATVGYVAIGYYALLGVAMCLMYKAAQVAVIQKRAWGQLATAVICMAGALMFPRIWMEMADSDLSYYYLYTEGLPKFYEGEGSMWIPYIIISVLLILYSVFAARKDVSSNKVTGTLQDKGGTNASWAAVAIGLASAIAVIVLRNDDPNLRLMLALDHDLWQEDWSAAQQRSSTLSVEPTRMNVVLTAIAMLRSGDAADSLFSMPIGAAPYSTPRSRRVPHDAVSMLFSYHTGMVNYAYRWAMENNVEYGISVERLKMMSKCALLHGEYDLAKKCLRTLSHTAFHKAWAEKYMAYAEHPEKIDDDAGLRVIRALIMEEDEFIHDHNQLEGYIWPALANVKTGGEEMLELSLLSALITREIDAFAEKMPFYARLHDTLPKHFQEGILIWSMVHENAEFLRYNIDQATKDRFAAFIRDQKQLGHLTLEAQRELMVQYKDTYWYYALYLRNMEII